MRDRPRRLHVRAAGAADSVGGHGRNGPPGAGSAFAVEAHPYQLRGAPRDPHLRPAARQQSVLRGTPCLPSRAVRILPGSDGHGRTQRPDDVRGSLSSTRASGRRRHHRARGGRHDGRRRKRAVGPALPPGGAACHGGVASSPFPSLRRAGSSRTRLLDTGCRNPVPFCAALVFLRRHGAAVPPVRIHYTPILVLFSACRRFSCTEPAKAC